MDNEFENDFVRMWISDGILYYTYKSDEVTLEMARDWVKNRIKLCNGETYPMLGDATQVKKFHTDARKYLSHGESLTYLSAGAFLIDSQVQKFIGNFWLKIDKPLLPAKLFTDKIEAKKWLQNYKINKLN